VSNILGPIAIDHFSDIENLVSFERAMFEGNSSKYRIKVFLLYIVIPNASLTVGVHVTFQDGAILSIH